MEVVLVGRSHLAAEQVRLSWGTILEMDEKD